MSDDYKKRVSSAIEKYIKKQEPSCNRPYTFLEKQVVKDILSRSKDIGWDLSPVDSKAVYLESQDRYLSSQAPVGFPDLVGNNLLGNAIYIEVKAPGRRKTLREAQREFLLKKISMNCFAVCVDSFELLEHYYLEWTKSHNQKKTLLDFLPHLPKRRGSNGNDTDSDPFALP